MRTKIYKSWTHPTGNGVRVVEGRGKKRIVVVYDSGLKTDWPILSRRNVVLYDRPEAIPKYLKKETEKMFVFLYPTRPVLRKHL